MSPQLRLLTGTLALGTLLGSVIAVTPARAVPMDTPTISVVRATRSYVQVHVTAGASGAPAGFYVEWMYKSVFDALGGWPEDPYDPSLYYCNFAGHPTWHVGGANGYNLGPNESIDIVLGELFDETAVTTNYASELSSGQGVVVHAYAQTNGSSSESAFTGDLLSATTASDNCTFTVGYWKTHYPAGWPTNFTSLTLGTNSYTKAQLESILNKPAGGNGLIILAHQLITTLINQKSGADVSSVSSTIADAQSLIGGLLIPPVGSGFLDPSITNADTNILDDYNNGVTGPGHCPTPTHRTTWGEVKTIYR
ncbi:MAG: hypothetical protein HYR73_06480 [Candidatus Eisenbacteria bacterium]|nr:hypothetical protein [Candidatus Eisenbacteria bacterium]